MALSLFPLVPENTKENPIGFLHSGQATHHRRMTMTMEIIPSIAYVDDQ